MVKVTINAKNIIGKIKPMHAVNNGPTEPRADQTMSNFEEYKAAGIPYARNHDAAIWYDAGGSHAVDVNAIFPNFDKDPEDESAYDFTLTDIYTLSTFKAGTEVFYRLGSAIEHWVKKYNTIMPTDFKKWAVVCEHIIRHYNEGWANGYKLGITYWEIWNEADGKKANGDQPNWSGTPEEYYELYAVTATHLKKCFPNLKIGGPAVSYMGQKDWLDGFFKHLNQTNAPLDFFSWHHYTGEAMWIEHSVKEANEMLEKYGRQDAEKILNEWNFIKSWGEGFVDSLHVIKRMKGAAFVSACMSVGQRCDVDMMMYYDARPCVFNGMFNDFLEPIKGYYPFRMFSQLYKLENEVACDSDNNDIRAICAGKDGKIAVLITYYSDEGNTDEKNMEVDLGGEYGVDVRCLDEEHDADVIFSVTGRKISLKMKPNTVLLITSEKEF